MDTFMNWMTDKFAPKVNKMAKNPWVSSIQSAILTAIPMIFIGSFMTILSLIKTYWPAMPDFSPISSFSFGIFSLFIAYLVPENLMNNKGHKNEAKISGLTGVAFFLMLLYPTYDKAGNLLLNANLLGTAGMLDALVAGLVVAMIMNLATKFNPFGEDSALPDFVATWFSTLIPILVLLVIGWLFTFQLNINVTTVISSIFSPLVHLGGSFFGFVIIIFLGYSFLYSFGISSWIIYPVEMAIALPAIAENAKMVAAGHAPTNIFVEETIGIFVIGGGGSTLALCIMMLFMAKSARMKMVARAAIIPSIFNINEPVVFGAPIAFNPFLMIPMWIMGLVGPILTYVVMKIGLVPIPGHVFGLWYLPTPIFAFLSTRSVAGPIYVVILFAISWIVYYPFFKFADKEALIEQEGEVA
ncbi:MAG TPA: PTS transporter subunit EIIC [Lactovum miscens]|uniref:PTS sugar transporter subunit IIC n=1 Tax=Lactovum miscens TaxID=190387 RepID=UPI002ED973B1